MKPASLLSAIALFIATPITASSFFDSCIPIDRPTFKTHVAAGNKPYLGPSGPVLDLDTGCVFLDVHAPGFADEYPEVYGLFISATQKYPAVIGRREVGSGESRAVMRDVLEVEAEGCGQYCVPSDGCLWPCRCVEQEDCFNDGFDTECWAIHRCVY